MSFDVFLQRFWAADGADAYRDLLARLLQPYLVEIGTSSTDLRLADGDAAIYGMDDLTPGFMVNQVSGGQAWDVLVAVAREAGLAILAVGYPAAVPGENLIGDLPAELRQDAVVVSSGEDRVRMIEAVTVALDDVAGWGAMLAEALRETGGPLAAGEWAWADGILGVTARPRQPAGPPTSPTPTSSSAPHGTSTA